MWAGRPRQHSVKRLRTVPFCFYYLLIKGVRVRVHIQTIVPELPEFQGLRLPEAMAAWNCSACSFTNGGGSHCEMCGLDLIEIVEKVERQAAKNRARSSIARSARTKRQAVKNRAAVKFPEDSCTICLSPVPGGQMPGAAAAPNVSSFPSWREVRSSMEAFGFGETLRRPSQDLLAIRAVHEAWGNELNGNQIAVMRDGMTRGT
jgi:hypothetical protein